MYILKNNLNNKYMKILKLFIAILLCLFSTTTNAQSQTESLTVPLSNPGKPYTLKIHNFSGMIKVTGYEGSDILINVTPGKDEENNEKDEERDDNRPEKGKGMKRISTSGTYELTAKEADNNVTVNTNNIEKVIDLDLKIPQNVKLEAGTVNEGEVIVENIKGEIDINNVNDNIKLSGITGSVMASTVSGDVEVSFLKVTPDVPMAFSTLSGEVEVTLPADIKATLKMKSDQGDIYSDFDIAAEKSAPEITEKKDKPKMYQIKKENWIIGKINGGGPELMFKTMSGDIYIKKSAK